MQWWALLWFSNIVINPRVLSANRVDLGFFCFINFPVLLPPPPELSQVDPHSDSHDDDDSQYHEPEVPVREGGIMSISYHIMSYVIISYRHQIVKYGFLTVQTMSSDVWRSQMEVGGRGYLNQGQLRFWTIDFIALFSTWHIITFFHFPSEVLPYSLRSQIRPNISINPW